MSEHDWWKLAGSATAFAVVWVGYSFISVIWHRWKQRHLEEDQRERRRS